MDTETQKRHRLYEQPLGGETERYPIFSPPAPGSSGFR